MGEEGEGEGVSVGGKRVSERDTKVKGQVQLTLVDLLNAAATFSDYKRH